jgi:hypothetical protein
MPDKDRSVRATLKRALVALVVLMPLGLGACAETIGAGAGAYAGNQFGKGSGRPPPPSVVRLAAPFSAMS